VTLPNKTDVFLGPPPPTTPPLQFHHARWCTATS